jgi:hypothetical protein
VHVGHARRDLFARCEDGIEAGNVVDAEFVPTPAALNKVRENILKAGIRGRLVANDFSGALISAATHTPLR